MLKIVKLSNFDRQCNLTPLEELKKNILIRNNYAVELYEDEKIIRLNIPHGNMYSVCNEQEWTEILNYLKSLGLDA